MLPARGAAEPRIASSGLAVQREEPPGAPTRGKGQRWAGLRVQPPTPLRSQLHWAVPTLHFPRSVLSSPAMLQPPRPVPSPPTFQPPPLGLTAGTAAELLGPGALQS